ncbi:hypothetical protein ES703_89409 [subsurface metagenome]
MKYTIWKCNRPPKEGTSNGGRIELTTDHPSSSYGIPVLAWCDHRGANVHVMGPGDAWTLATGEPPIPGATPTHRRIPSDAKSPLFYSGADLVEGWARHPGRTAEERAAAQLFLVGPLSWSRQLTPEEAQEYVNTLAERLNRLAADMADLGVEMHVVGPAGNAPTPGTLAAPENGSGSPCAD